MLSFIGSGIQLDLVKNSAKYSSLVGTKGWEASQLPEWEDALQMIHEKGHFNHVELVK